MCSAIEFTDGWVYSAQGLIDRGYEIPADALAEATAILDVTVGFATGEHYDVDTCFCCVDAEILLRALGIRYACDPICGNLIVVS